jgi:MFS transporter, PAT family, beta-lactamase induction signal transducer AmpG
MIDIASAQQPHRHSHPVVFMFLVLPFGISSGYVTVAYAYLFSKAGVPVDAVAALVGAAMLPHVIKFLWAPLVDTTLSLKKWYILSGIITAAGIFATGILPVQVSSLPMLTFIVVVVNVAVSFLGMTTNGLAAYDVPDHMKGRASGYMQAGNLGGSGLGGGIGLWLAQHMQQTWMATGILSIACILCCFGLFFVKEPQSTIRAEKILHTVENLVKDIWLTLKTRMGILAIVLCFLPLGTGAASNLWSAVAGDWHASAETVGLWTGIMSGIITAAGCLVGGWMCDRMDRKLAYVIFGLMQVICAVAMAIAPHTEIMYIIWTSIYAVTIGLSYAGFSAFVFEAIGKGAAATKFTVYASLSNFPIYYMTLVEGKAHTLWGPKGMLNTEAGFGIIGVVMFLVLLALVKRRKKEMPAMVETMIDRR